MRQLSADWYTKLLYTKKGKTCGGAHPLTLLILDVHLLLKLHGELCITLQLRHAARRLLEHQQLVGPTYNPFFIAPPWQPVTSTQEVKMRF